ncbi:unnamed protein product [Arctogadus glacialis]
MVFPPPYKEPWSAATGEHNSVRPANSNRAPETSLTALGAQCHRPNFSPARICVAETESTGRESEMCLRLSCTWQHYNSAGMAMDADFPSKLQKQRRMRSDAQTRVMNEDVGGTS